MDGGGKNNSSHQILPDMLMGEKSGDKQESKPAPK
jgi:hypothetical protein